MSVARSIWPHGLPDGWYWTTLGEMSEKPQYGWTTKASTDRGSVKLLRTTDITSGSLNWSSVPYCEEEPKDVEKYLLAPGDIVISRAGSVGFSYLLDRVERAVFASYLIRFRLRPGVNRKYVYYYLKSPRYWREIGASQLGIAIPNVNATKIASVPVPIAPLDQQDRIVAEIEEQFSRLDEAVANLKRVKANLKRYRAAVLKAAVEGRLVPTEAELARREGRGYETGGQLLVRILKERCAAWDVQKVKVRAKTYDDPQPLDTSNLTELPEGWTWVTFGQVAERITKGSSPNWQGFEYCASGIPFVRSQNVRWGETDLTDLAFLPPAFNEVEKKAVLKEGDLLLNIVGASIGRAAVAPKSVAGGNVNQAVALIRLTEVGAWNHYVLIYLLSAYCQRRIHSQKVDVARANFSLEEIKAMPFALPPLAEQHRIVAEADRRLSMAEESQAQIDAILRRAEGLRRAILKRAFEARLG